MENIGDYLARIEDFEAQVEQGLEFRIKELISLDEAKSEELTSLKKRIMAEIKFADETGEKMSTDLQLTEQEFETVYRRILIKNEDILKENEISDFRTFMESLGLWNAGRDEYVHSVFAENLLEVKLFGVEIDFALPLGSSKAAIARYEDIIGVIESRPDLRPYIASGMVLKPYGERRLEFVVSIDGEEVKYLADYNGVFRIVSEPKHGQERALLKAKIEEKRFRDSIVAAAEQDKSLSDVVRSNIILQVDLRSKHAEVDLVDGDIPEYYRKFIQKLLVLEQRNKDLDKECRTRVLLDETTDTVVHEIGDRDHLHSYRYEYFTADGKRIKSLEIVGNMNHVDEKYDPHTGATVEYNRYRDNGLIETRRYRTTGEQIDVRKYRVDGSLSSRVIDNQTEYYSADGEEVLFKRISEGADYDCYMLTKEGGLFTILSKMNQQGADLTPDQYLDMLADNLPPEKLHIFLELFMQYVHDSADPDNPLENGTEEKHGDYWQTAYQTIARYENGKMLGDCDDYAFLAKEILRRQGIDAQVLLVPGHAICIWAEQDEKGKYHARSIGTFGLDVNGNRYGAEVDPAKAEGYDTLEEALNSLMVKYAEGGKGLEQGGQYHLTEYIEMLDVTDSGEKLKVLVPVGLLIKPGMVSRILNAERFILDEEFEPAIKIYEALKQEDPGNALYYERRIAYIYYEHLFDYDQALERYNKLMKAGYYEDVVIYYRLIEHYLEIEEEGTVIEILKRLDSSNADISGYKYVEFIDFAYHYGENDLALSLLAKMEDVFINKPITIPSFAFDALPNLYALFDDSGDLFSAFVERARKENPNDKWLWDNLERIE